MLSWNRGSTGAGFQDRLDGLVREGAKRESSRAGVLQTIFSVLLFQPQDPQAAAVSLDGIGSGGEDRLHHLFGIGADRGAPRDQAGGRPLLVLAMGRGQMFLQGGVPSLEEAAGVGRHSLPLVEDLHGAGRTAVP